MKLSKGLFQMSAVMVRAAALLIALAAAVNLAAAQTPADGRLERIATTKSIRIAYRFDAAPFSFLNDAKEPIGYTIDLCKLVVRSIERQIGLQQLAIEWVPVSTETRFETVASGSADMECGASSVTLERMKQVDFSIFVFVETTGLVVRSASSIRSVSDMTGKTIAVIAGTTNQRALADQVKQGTLKVTLITVKSRDEGIAALEDGRADGFASDKLLLAGSHPTDPKALSMLPDDLSFEPYGIALPRSDSPFRLAVNTGLAEVYRSGQVIDVFEKWFRPIGLQPGTLLRAAYIFGAFLD